MSIVDDFKCYQNWGPDGYKFEVTPKGSVIDDLCESFRQVERAWKAEDVFFKHQVNGTYRAELSGGALKDGVIKINFNVTAPNPSKVIEENYNNDLECIMSDDPINGLELASSIHHPDGREVLIQHRKKKMARKIAEHLLYNNFIHFREIEDPIKDQIILRGKLYAVPIDENGTMEMKKPMNTAEGDSLVSTFKKIYEKELT